ncbi:uncharacterized protein LOC127727121 isoform X8 [Mytilus californianus]|uniref:uncharacterized protein LOC127727121 isoform X8 n=1 Tax=Mytilus californianus TaxID=6549 RepID=UPI0022466A55|nr:uncharacterized protein LOC127727121 isoform X8 [Mytilus californianus]
MAQRYITAMDFADMHARKILRKQAMIISREIQKRPLGEIEIKHRYYPPQPVLSCRTVNIDVTGTRTYRPKSSTDIIKEQHQLIHSIYNKPRNIQSAPSKGRRPQSPNRQYYGDQDHLRKFKRLNIEIQGRPLTSKSQPSTPRTNRPRSNLRPKTAVSEEAEYYNIESSVGSRVAHQLQKGDKVRIGINGSVQSQDLKVKKWTRESSYIKEEEPEKKSNGVMIIPLCWDDAVSSPVTKVISPRGEPEERAKPNLCETHPVLFTKENEEDRMKEKISMTIIERPGSYKVKHRPKSRTYVTGHEQNNKMVDITIDQKSLDDESMLHNLSVDDVLRHTLDNRRTHHKSEDSLDGSSIYFEQNGMSPRMDDSKENVRSPSKISIVDSHASDRSDISSKHSKAKVVTLNYSIGRSNTSDLIVGPPTGSLVRSNTDISLKSASSVRGSDKSYRNSERSGSKLGYRSSSGRSGRIGSPALYSSFGPKSETEYIQISSQIKMPIPNPPHPSIPKQDEYISQAKTNEAIRQVTKQNKVQVVEKEREVKQTTPAPAPSPEPPVEEKQETKVADPKRSAPLSPATVAINIPTAEQFEGESPWPTNRTGTEVETTSRLKKEGSDLQKITENSIEKTVKFKDDVS